MPCYSHIGYVNQYKIIVDNSVKNIITEETTMNKKLTEIYKSLSGGEGLKHFSYSQLSSYKPISMWLVDYVCRTQAQRRKDKKGYKLGFGSVANNTAQKLIGKYYFEGAERHEIKDRDYNKIYKFEFNEYLKGAKDDEDRLKRENIQSYIHKTIQNILSAVKNIFGDKELSCERYVDLIIKDVLIGMTGRIDFESFDSIAECKTKPPSVKDFKDSFRTYSQALPKTPDEDNITQLSFYHLATDKTPFLFYANDKDFIIFDDTHEKLKKDFMEYKLELLFNKARTVQRLLIVSNGDPKIMAGLVERPNTNHWTMNDASEEQLSIIKQLWG